MASKMDEGLARSPVHLLHRVGQCAEELFQAEIGDADLTARQLAVLTAVAQEEGLSQTGIVERTGIDRSTLADIVPRLSKKGLLQRRRTREDARAYAVKLTDEGGSCCARWVRSPRRWTSGYCRPWVAGRMTSSTGCKA